MRNRLHPLLSLAGTQPARRRLGLALAGGGVIGGMYEVGVLAALEEKLEGESPFDIFVGCSAGSVVAALMASGIHALDLYRILDQDLDDPLNFRRGAMFSSRSIRKTAKHFLRFIWAVLFGAAGGFRRSLAESLARAESELPAGLFPLDGLELFVREGLASRGLPNSFRDVRSTLLIPAIDLDRAHRVVFGVGNLRDVPISHAVTASSALPFVFEPFSIRGRDYVDGGVGFSGHADLAAECGADVVLVVHPLVPVDMKRGVRLRSRGLYAIMQQANRIDGHNLHQLGFKMLSLNYPKTEFVLLEPPRSSTPLFCNTLSFCAAQAALRYGFSSTREWLAGQGAGFLHHLLPPARQTCLVS
ncbi:MAG TPA: patatin-like phospholipase family protein [Thermoanaerobaculia bacterium]|nr:patatin-like phospholipase family protein [Thermoanaerobaculia bacterium]